MKPPSMNSSYRRHFSFESCSLPLTEAYGIILTTKRYSVGVLAVYRQI